MKKYINYRQPTTGKDYDVIELNKIYNMDCLEA